MQNRKFKKINNKRGVTLLIAIVVTSMMLMVSFVVANVALKQLVLADAGVESQYAFYNADSGADCAVYWDIKNSTVSQFATSTAGTITCGSNTIGVGNPQTVSTVPSVSALIGGGGNSNPTSIFQLDFAKGCAIVRVTKQNNGYTTVDSRGYNTCNTSAIKRYERGITLTYEGNNNLIYGSSGNASSIGHIQLSSTALSFSATAGNTPAAQNVTIQNTGVGAYSWTGSADQSWCHISPTSGSINAGSSATLSISVDAIGSAGTYNCTVTITSTNADNSPQTISVTYTVSTAFTCASGGTVTTSGNYKIHTFTASGTFTVTCPGTVEYLIVGGGAGGAAGTSGGGGGGGGQVKSGSIAVSVTSYTVTLGNGGGGGGNYGSAGGASSFNSISSAGGSGGAYDDLNGVSGTIGGGGGAWAGGGGSNPGTGTVSRGGYGDTNAGGGGGGAGGNGGNGVNANPYVGGTGGAGVSSSISGSSICYGGGGGGSSYNNSGPASCGGGIGAANAGNGAAGTANRGGGGGAGRFGSGGAGGKGVVIIRYIYQ
ncbi:MAG: hypothetical protein AB201_00700 [Parcubacteria bacterium C7867-006]|nr:MAG: hypothetical protein AB201_00700 [Parcubacteria bacterium C7867-006]